MRIQSLNCKHYKGFQDLSISIDGKSTVIFGENGVGKSTILSMVNYLFYPFLKRFTKELPKNYEKFNFYDFNRDINGDIATALGVSGVVRLLDDEYVLERSAETQKVKLSAKNGSKQSAAEKKQYDTFWANFTAAYSLLDDVAPMSIPVFASYSTNRSVLDIPTRIRTRHDFTKYTAYDSAIDTAVDFRLFFEWYRAREDLENQIINDKRDFSYTDKQLDCVRKAISAMLGDVDRIRVERSPLALIVEKNGVKLSVDTLSDGEKCTLALMGDLARRLSIANPSLDNPLEGKGIVAIDEIELHMHPQWQRKILGVLRSVFPNIQFIITTHSPQILGEIDASYKIVMLCRTEHGIESRKLPRLDGFDANTILEEYMDTPSKNIKTRQLIDTINESICKAKFPDAEKLLVRLEEITGKDDSEVVLLRGFLRRQKIFYEENN